jgi:hypothetical protein
METGVVDPRSPLVKAAMLDHAARNAADWLEELYQRVADVLTRAEVEERDRGFHVAPVPRVDIAQTQLHVLLRDRLLRQPGGFEGGV